MQVPMFDLKVQFSRIRDEVLPAVVAVLDSQDCCNGGPVRKFEAELAAELGCKHVLGCSSGTDALLMCLMALGIGQGDEVITTPFTFFATAGTIWRTGARPVFVDIRPDTFNINPELIEAAITPRTKAIMPVHLFGQGAQIEAICEIARRHNLPVIEDTAQGVAERRSGKCLGTFGLAGCLSFYPTKNLGDAGDAGAIMTDDDAFADLLRSIRVHGQSSTYVHQHVGGMFRMDSVQAAVLSVKLRHLPQYTARRRANAAIYGRVLAGCPGVTIPVTAAGNEHIYHQYVIRSPRRDELQKFLKANEIGSGVFYPLSLHQQECFKSLGYKAGDFPQSEKAAAEVLALPIYPELTEQQVTFAAAKVREFATVAT